MASQVTGKIQRAVGGFHYKKWVFLYRYHQKYSGTSTPLFHAALLVMGFGMWNEGYRRAEKLKSLAYNSRRDKTNGAVSNAWQAERDQQDLSIDELEAAVYRARTSTWADDLLLGEERTAWPEQFAGVPIFHDGKGNGPLPKTKGL